jgi:hypothetical protein
LPRGQVSAIMIRKWAEPTDASSPVCGSSAMAAENEEQR